MEIFVGKMFKMEVWEELLKSMRIGEVAEFWCDAVHTGLYPIVSKGMRMIAQGKDPLEGQKHMCGMGNMFSYHSTGYPELDELMREPQPLIFIMELISVGDPMSYERESWMMEKDDKLKAVPLLHAQGNSLVKQGSYREAAKRYQEAVVMMRAAQSREMPGHEDYINLGRLIIPLVLNYCQCMLELEEYYEVIEHTTELLEKHKDCVKAYYKRAKAHAAVWNEKEARRDFRMVAELDITLARLVHRELQNLSETMKEKYWEEKEQYWNKLEKRNEGMGKKGEEDEERNGKVEKEGEEEEEETSLTGVVKMKQIDVDSLKIEAQEPGHKVDKAKEVAEEPATNEKPATGLDGKTGTNESAPAALEEKDWQEMLRLTMHLQKEGNFHMEEKHHDEAAAKFTEALQYVNYLQTKRVAYKGEDWESLEKVRVPLMLNLSQCRLELHEYQQVVELTSCLLKRHKGSMRALYQRARAHAALYHLEDARSDLLKIQKRHPQFKPIVRLEMKKLGENVRAKSVKEKKNYWSTLEDKYGKGEKAQVPGKKAGKKKKAVKWTDQAAKKDGATLEEIKEGPKEGSSTEIKDGNEGAAGKMVAAVALEAAAVEAEVAAAAGSDHTPIKQDKAPGAAGAGEDKANKTPRSGEDKTAEGAPLAAASAASHIFKGTNEIKAPAEIKGESANEHSPDVADGTVQTQPANETAPEPAPDTGVGSSGKAGAAETDRLAGQTDTAGEKAKDGGTGAKQGAKKKATTPQTPDAKGPPKGAACGKPKPTTPAGRGNKPPTHAPKQKNKKKK
ncbi:uncharacterized protein LOC121694321 isoform X2 [Alosa sapidissima]|nr:uncharacterized protein LOC121694321 isoform X2 [Alosa sapidissima]